MKVAKYKGARNLQNSFEILQLIKNMLKITE